MNHVTITTYNRPTLLRRLLYDLKIQLPPGSSVSVYDDGSTADNSSAQRLAEECGWRFTRLEHHGKHGLWRLWNRILRDCQAIQADLFYFLPDDVRLCRNFFGVTGNVWNHILDDRKIALTLLRDSGREGKACWTPVRPSYVHGVINIGWLDMLFMSDRKFFDAAGQIPEQLESRWSRKPTRSSGVGQYLSKKLVDDGRTLYCAMRSSVAHLNGSSVMHPELRQLQPLRTLRFVDGEAACRALSNDEPVVAALASVPERTALLERVVASLRDQVDRVLVYLNGYQDVPAFLDDPRITVARSQLHGDLGDAGKFFWAEGARGYYLTCDDDLEYPKDYVRTMLSAVEYYDRRALVSLHGAVLVEPIQSFYRSRKVYRCLGSVAADEPVDVPGTGCLAYHTSAMKLSMADFPTPNMADVHLAVAAQKQSIPRYAIAHEQGWLLNLLQGTEPTIYDAFRRNDSEQTQRVRAAGPWSALGAAKKTQVLAVLTAPREFDYLSSTLDRLDGVAGPWDGRKLVVCDGLALAAIPGWEVHQTGVDGKCIGPVRAFEMLLALAGNADMLLFVHDDVRLCRGALPYIQRLGVPSDLAAVVYYQEGWAEAQRGLHVGTFGHHFVGAICTAFSRRAIEKFSSVDLSYWPIRHGLDAVISKALAGERYAVHAPHLAQHVGCSPAVQRMVALGERTSTSYADEVELSTPGGLPRLQLPTSPTGLGLTSRRTLP